VQDPAMHGVTDRIRAVSERVILTQHTTLDAASGATRLLTEAFEQANVLYTFSVLPQPNQAPHLDWVQLHSAGINHVIQHPLFATDVIFTTASGLHAINIGEYVMASILAWARRLPEMFDLQRKSEWPSNRWTRYMPSELHGATLGIVGYGSLGRQVGRLAKTFGMKVLAVKRHAQLREERDAFGLPALGDPGGALPDALYSPQQLRDMLPQCDYAGLSVPLTPETRGLLGEAEFNAMRSDAYFINIARGSIVQQEALIQALQNRHIAGAALDVAAVEPLSPDSPLWDMKNVIITPHVSGHSVSVNARAIDLFCENLLRYQHGEPLVNVVDRQSGY